MNAIRVLFIWTLCWAFVQPLKLPDYIKPCHYNAPDIDDCVLKTAKATVPHMINGDPKYKIPPLDPMLIKELTVNQDTGSVGLAINGHDVYIRGIKDAEIKDLKFDFKNQKFTLNAYIPELHVEFIYNVTGKILLLPIQGSGNGTLAFYKVRANYTYEWENKKMKDGKEHYSIKKSKLAFDPEKVRTNLENLFNGNKLLGDNMNLFMNENWEEIHKEVGPGVAEAVNKYIRQVFSNLYASVPIENLFIYDAV